MAEADDSMPGVVLYNWPEGYCEEELRFASVDQLGREPYDVIIVGAGVVGCGLAYKLSQYQVRVLVLDRKHDVSEATSKANSAIVHTGFDATPGTLESQLVTSASRMWPEMAAKLQIPLEKTAAVLLAIDDEQDHLIPKIHEKALKNGVDDVEILTAAQIRQMEPNASPNVRSGILVPRESVADPFTTSVAYAEVAHANGVDFVLGVDVVGIEDAGNGLKSAVTADGHRFAGKMIVNAAGLGAWHLAQSYGGADFHINPRRGEFLIYDKLASKLVSRILLPVPTPTTKGILVSPTIFGNLIMGPTADDLPLDQVDATDTTPDGLDHVRRGGEKLCPELGNWPVVATYAGLRCNCEEGSYIIRPNDGMPGVMSVIGIRSTGFTASPTLAEHLIERLVEDCGLVLQPKPDAVDSRPESRMPGWWGKRPFEDAEKVAADPAFGRLICYCEKITEGEIIDAINSPLRPRTMDALRRRTRAGMGRCQGFNCYVHIAELLSKVSGVPMERITKCGPGSEIVPGER